MSTTAKLLTLSLCLTLVGCRGMRGGKTSERERLQYEYVEQFLSRFGSGDEESPSDEELSELAGLTLAYDERQLSEEDKPRFEQLQRRLDSLKARYLQDDSAEEGTSRRQVSGDGTIISYQETLLSQTSYYPVYLYRGDTLHLSASSEAPLQLSLINYDSKRVELARTAKELDQQVHIPHEAIYLIKVKPSAAGQYASLSVNYTSRVIRHPEVTESVREAHKGDFLALPESELVTNPVFEEPKKIALRGQLKAAFSGHYRSIISLPVPPNTQALLYSLRISTNENVVASDGTFPDQLQTSYSIHKLLGLTLYEHEGGRGRASLINLMLGDTRPPKEEDAYCNFYVFPSQRDAKRWQDGTAGGAKFNYDVDQSQLGTQSCNGRLKPARKQRSIYLGFENERFRYDTYIWLEVVSLAEQTAYTQPVYSISNR